MKKALFALLLTSMTTLSFANSTKPNPSNQVELRSEILSLIGTPLLENSDEEKIQIHFTINTDREVVVLSTNNEQLDSYIKSRLNYKKLDAANAMINKRYILPLTVVRG